MAAKDASANSSCRLMRDKGLRDLQRTVKAFYVQLEAEFLAGTATRTTIDALITKHKLTFDAIGSSFTEDIKMHRHSI